MKRWEKTPFNLFLICAAIYVAVTGYGRLVEKEREAQEMAQMHQDVEALGAELNDLEGEVDRLRDLLTMIFGEPVPQYALRSTTVIASSYNPVEAQCDADPLIASDNKLVMPGVLALPKHYRLELGLKMGQKVILSGLGPFTVRDHMSSRKPRGRVDIISFIPEWSKKFGKREVTMYWVAGS